MQLIGLQSYATHQKNERGHSFRSCLASRLLRESWNISNPVPRRIPLVSIFAWKVERDDRMSVEVAVCSTVVMNMGCPWSRGWVDIRSCIMGGEAFELRECMIRFLELPDLIPLLTKLEETIAVSSNSKGFFTLEESFSQLTDRIAFAVHIQLWGKSPETQSISLTILWKATASKHDGTGSRI